MESEHRPVVVTGGYKGQYDKASKTRTTVKHGPKTLHSYDLRDLAALSALDVTDTAIAGNARDKEA